MCGCWSRCTQRGSLRFISAFLPVILLAVSHGQTLRMGGHPSDQPVQEVPKQRRKAFPAQTEPAFPLAHSRVFAAQLHPAPTMGLLGCVWHQHPRNLLQAGRNKVERCVYNCWEGGKHRRGSRICPAWQSHGPAVKELVLQEEKWRASSKLALLSALAAINKEGTGQRYWIIKLADSRALSREGMCCMLSR